MLRIDPHLVSTHKLQAKAAMGHTIPARKRAIHHSDIYDPLDTHQARQERVVGPLMPILMASTVDLQNP